jgi:hypothetical protein
MLKKHYSLLPNAIMVNVVAPSKEILFFNQATVELRDRAENDLNLEQTL